MSFGLPRGTETKLTYGGYLKLSELTSLQQVRSENHHDEMLFIIIHQVYELWFKLLLHELQTIVQYLREDHIHEANHLLERCIEILHVLINQIAVLETMTPVDFLAFRDHLMPASGLQSVQFRELEFISGAKDASVLNRYPENSPEYLVLKKRLDEPSLPDAFYQFLQKRGIGSGPNASSEQRVEALKEIYDHSNKWADLYFLAERCIEYDEQFALWRLTHIKMVERIIGGKPGSGGTEGVPYLRKTLEKRFFPELWEVRMHLSR